jgi:hypothetical protein
MPAFGLHQRERLPGREGDALKKREARTRARATAEARQQPSGNTAEGNGPRGPIEFEFFPARLSSHGFPFFAFGSRLREAVRPPA